MSGRKGRVVGVRKSSGVRGHSSAASIAASRPKTQVSVESGFKKVLSANDKAERITYTR